MSFGRKESEFEKVEYYTTYSTRKTTNFHVETSDGEKEMSLGEKNWNSKKWSTSQRIRSSVCPPVFSYMVQVNDRGDSFVRG